MTDTEYTLVDPFALQQTEIVRATPSGGGDSVIYGEVILVDAKNFYVTVRVDGAEATVALTMHDWLFGIIKPENFVPQEDGLYVAVEDADSEAGVAGAERIIRRFNGVFTDVLSGNVIEEADLPELAPLRVTSAATFAQPTAPEVVVPEESTSTEIVPFEEEQP